MTSAGNRERQLAEMHEKRHQKFWADPFYADFPHLYEEIDISSSSMSYGCSIGKGWKPLIRELCFQLVELDSGVVFVQIKEKFGGLRIYYRFAQMSTGQEPTEWQIQEADRLIEETVRKADESCETCGKPGSLRKTKREWLYRSCDEHI